MKMIRPCIRFFDYTGIFPKGKKPRICALVVGIILAGIFMMPSLANSQWLTLFDGKSLEGWQVNENPESWELRDSAIVAIGKRSHLFYTGEHQPFTNFVLQVDVYTERWSNGGIYFLTEFQSDGWPETGFEAQVNNTAFDWKKTGSLYGIKNVLFFSPADDKQWWTQEIRVEGRHITISIDGEIVVEYTLEEGVRPDTGTIALQSHDRRSVVQYKNIRILPLD